MIVVCFMMKNITNQTHASLPIWSVPHAVVFEVSIAIISALVIFTSCCVLKYVYLKENRSRTDLLFAITSITDIGVGLLALPLTGVDVACKTFIECSASIRYLIIASMFFPLFSYIITTVIAIDRLLLITKHYKYKTIVTTKRLKIIVAFFFVLSIGHSFLTVYYVKYLQRHFFIFKVAILSIMITLPLMIVIAYTYILCYVYRSSNAISHYKVNGKNNNNKITKSIMLILISQVISILPVLSIQLLFTIDTFSDFVNANLELCYALAYWFELIQSSQFFVNGMILLSNHRQDTRNINVKTEEVVCLNDT